jgi:hypothetical protein
LDELDQEKHARTRLDETTEWAVGQQLATDGLALGTPSLADSVAAAATIPSRDMALAVATLEQAAADAGFGSEWWLHSPVFGAAFLAQDRQLLDGGVSPTGAPWIISPGYPAAAAPTTLRLWATGPVWVGVTDMHSYQSINRREGDDVAYGQRDGIVAFNPCINLYIDITL